MSSSQIDFGAFNMSRFYGDGPPYLPNNRQKRAAPTKADADREARRAIKRLKRRARQLKEIDPEQARRLSRLVRLLKSCRQDSRCFSGACPLCQRAVQCWLVRALTRFVDRVGEPLGIASIIPTARFAIGDPAAVEGTSDLVRSLNTVESNAGITIAVGGIDFSVNEHANNAFAPHIQPHYWFFAPLSQLRAARGELNSRYSEQSARHTCVRILPFDGDLRGYAYAFKWQFSRRVTLPPKVSETGKTLRRQNTRNRSLRSLEHVHLYDVLDQVGLSGRLILHGVDVRRSRRGRPVIRFKRDPDTGGE